MSWNPTKTQETARRLVESRMSGQARENFAGGDIPPDLETAYAVQSQVIQQWPDKLVGFKVGGIPPQFREQFPADWLVGPVFAKNVYDIDPPNPLDFPVYENGFAAFEPELILQVSTKVVNEQNDWTAELARGEIERVFLGGEIAASPNLNVNVFGPGSIISDFGNNAGIILGKEIPLAQLDDALSVMTETRIDDKSINKCEPGAAPGGPLGALAFLLNHLRDNYDLYDLPDILLVSSGAITGVHQSHIGATGEFDYSGFEVQTIRLVGGGMQV